MKKIEKTKAFLTCEEKPNEREKKRKRFSKKKKKIFKS